MLGFLHLSGAEVLYMSLLTRVTPEKSGSSHNFLKAWFGAGNIFLKSSLRADRMFF